MHVVAPDETGLKEAAAAIQRGEIVAYPTETVYGLGVDPFQDAAIERLYAAKARSAKSPVLLIVGDFSQLDDVVGPISDQARKYMEIFWPGPLTLILPASPKLSRLLNAGAGRIGVRMPACEIARSLCIAAGRAITSTSANISGQPAALSVAGLDVPNVSVAVDGGILDHSATSTVFDPDSGVVYREGVIAAAHLVAALP